MWSVVRCPWARVLQNICITTVNFLASSSKDYGIFMLTRSCWQALNFDYSLLHVCSGLLCVYCWSCSHGLLSMVHMQWHFLQKCHSRFLLRNEMSKCHSCDGPVSLLFVSLTSQYLFTCSSSERVFSAGPVQSLCHSLICRFFFYLFISSGKMMINFDLPVL